MKRLSIISINSEIFEYSKYVLYLVDEMAKYCADVVICTSANIDQILFEELSKRTQRIFQYNNYINVNRWRDVWINKIDKIDKEKYDEVIFFDDSVFGPITSLDNVFKEMDAKNVDFWGMSSHGRIHFQNEQVIYPRFIQTYFLAIRKKLFLSDDFNDYIHELSHFKNYDDACRKFEFIFTEKFSSLGYRWETYINTQKLENDNSDHFISFILFDLYDMVVNHNYPFIPKVIFDISEETIQTYNLCDDLYRTIEYVKENTNYNIEYILDNVVKRLNLHDLISKLKLYYIVEESKDYVQHYQKYALFAHLFYEDLLEYSINRILNVPLYFDIYISTDSNEKANIIHKLFAKSGREVNVNIYTGKGRDLGTLLIGFRKKVLEYDIVCYVHDKKSSQMDYVTVGQGFNNFLWENMLDTPEYVKGVLKILEKDSYLGLLAPPMIYHGTYFHTSINSWTICFDEARRIAKKMRLQLNINKEKNPVALGSVFWFKVDSLKKLFEFEFCEEDFPDEPMPVDGSFSHALERLFPYIAQEAGYYSGNIITNYNAANRMITIQNTSNQLMKSICQFKGIDAATLELTLISMKQVLKVRNKTRKNLWESILTFFKRM